MISLGILWLGNYLINRGMRNSTMTSAANEDDSSDSSSETTTTASRFRPFMLLNYLKIYILDFFTIFKQLCTLRNFVLFVLVNFLNIFTVSLFDSFKVRYIRSYVHPWMQIYLSGNNTQNIASIYLTFCTFFAECFAVLNSYLSIRYSAYSLLRNTFIVRVCVSSISLIAFLIFIPQESISESIIPTLFLLVNLIVLGSVGRLLEISLSNVVDEDFRTNKRSEKSSGNIYGINALLTKPAFSIAPSIAALFIGKDAQSNDSTTAMPTLFYLFVFGNLVCAVLQIVLWKFYTLRGSSQTR